MTVKQTLTPLSASRISTAKGCSWRYWCNYGLKLPDGTNDGSSRGSVCHTIFEVLGNKRHIKHYDKIIAEQDIFASGAVKRLVLKHAKNLEVDDHENFKMIREMILNGLNYDFFGQSMGELTYSASELDFDLTHEDNEIKYRIKGFIDKIFIFDGGKRCLIRDFKTSKKKYDDEEFKDNGQNLMYCLAVTHLFPEVKESCAEFLFLKPELFAEGPQRSEVLTKEELEGFEVYLTRAQRYIDNFTEESATKHLAKNRGYPKSGFSGALMCGYAKYPGHIKPATGEPYWHCPFKFGFDYYRVETTDGKFVKNISAQNILDLDFKDSDKYKVIRKRYHGCPAFNKKYSAPPV